MAAGGWQSTGSGDRPQQRQRRQRPRQRRGARRARAQRARTANGREGEYGVSAAEGLGIGSALTADRYSKMVKSVWRGNVLMADVHLCWSWDGAFLNGVNVGAVVLQSGTLIFSRLPVLRGRAVEVLSLARRRTPTRARAQEFALSTFR